MWPADKNIQSALGIKANEEKWSFSSHFWPLLKQEAAGAVWKIGSSLKPDRHTTKFDQIKLVLIRDFCPRAYTGTPRGDKYHAVRNQRQSRFAT